MHYRGPKAIRSEFKKLENISHLNQQNAHFLFIIQYNFFFTVKSVQHVSVPYYKTIIMDPYRESHKITKQQIMVHIKISRYKM
jgi:hypothetical protein